jgi:hypothetical protein
MGICAREQVVDWWIQTIRTNRILIDETSKGIRRAIENGRVPIQADVELRRYLVENTERIISEDLSH